MNLRGRVKSIFFESRELFGADCTANIAEAVDIVTRSLRKGGKVLICGNGGSAEQASHFAGELVGRFRTDRKALPAIALGTSLATLTANANDLGYGAVFAREVEAHGRRGDVLFALSTSGNSPNILAAVGVAKKLGLKTIGLSGEEGKLKEMVHLPLAVPSRVTARVQEVHLVMIHAISELVEEIMAQGSRRKAKRS